MKKLNLKPYKNKAELMNSLTRVLKKDYGVELSEEELEESADNLTNFFSCLLDCSISKNEKQ